MIPATTSDLARLQELDRGALLDLWRRLHGREPPRNASRQFLRYCIAFHIQEDTHGGLSPSIRRQLKRIAKNGTAAVASGTARTAIKPGTRLLRTWHGKAYEVTVVVNGYVLDSKRYRSLSAVARAITGTRWNGWAFFGLKQTHNGAAIAAGRPDAS